MGSFFDKLQAASDRLRDVRNSEYDGLRRAGWDKSDAWDEANARFSERYEAVRSALIAEDMRQ